MTLQPKPISPYSWRSLQTRITLLTLAVFLSLLWSLAWYAERALRSDMEQLLGQQQLATVTLHAQELNQTMRSRLRMLENVAKLATPMMSGPTQALADFLQARPTLVEFFTGGMTFVDVRGQALATYRHRPPTVMPT